MFIFARWVTWCWYCIHVLCWYFAIIYLTIYHRHFWCITTQGVCPNGVFLCCHIHWPEPPRGGVLWTWVLKMTIYLLWWINFPFCHIVIYLRSWISFSLLLHQKHEFYPHDITTLLSKEAWILPPWYHHIIIWGSHRNKYFSTLNKNISAGQGLTF